MDLTPPTLKTYEKKSTPFEKKHIKANSENRLIVHSEDRDLHNMVIKSVNKKEWYLFPGSTQELKDELLSGKKLDVIFEPTLPMPVKLDPVKVTAVKLWMYHGIQFLRYHHNETKWNMFGGSSYISTMKITGTHLYFRKKDNPQHVESELWESIYLFSIKFVVDGYNSDYFLRRKSKVDLLSCFEIVTEEGYSILMEVLKTKDEKEVKRREYIAAETARIAKYTPEKLYDEDLMGEIASSYKDKVALEKKKIEDLNAINRKKNEQNEANGIPERFPVEEEETTEQVALRRQKFCELIVGGLKSIVDEIRSSKVFLGPDGVPKRRIAAKEVLRKNM